MKTSATKLMQQVTGADRRGGSICPVAQGVFSTLQASAGHRDRGNLDEIGSAASVTSC